MNVVRKQVHACTHAVACKHVQRGQVGAGTRAHAHVVEEVLGRRNRVGDRRLDVPDASLACTHITHAHSHVHGCAHRRLKLCRRRCWVRGSELLDAGIQLPAHVPKRFGAAKAPLALQRLALLRLQRSRHICVEETTSSACTEPVHAA